MEQFAKKSRFFKHLPICLLLSLPVFFNLSLPGGKFAPITEARAADRLTMAVVDVTRKDIPPASWPELYRLLLNELAKEESFSVMNPEEVADILNARPVSPDTAYQLKKAGEYLEAGKGLYENLKFDQATEKLKKAKETLLNNLEAIEDLKTLHDTYLYLAMSYLGMGNEEKGVDEFTEGLIIFPRMNLGEGELLPLVTESFSRAREKLREIPKAKLNIRSNPPSVLVYLDGSQIGTTPAVIGEVTLGTHLLWGEKAAYLTSTKKLVLDTEKTYDLLIELAYKRELDLFERLREDIIKKRAVIKETTTNALGLGSLLGADLLLVTALQAPFEDEYSLDAYLFSIKDQIYLVKKTVRFSPAIEEAGEKIRDLAQLIILEPETGRMAKLTRERKSKRMKAYLWAAGGSAILGGSLGTRLKASKEADEYKSALGDYNNYILSGAVLDPARLADYEKKMDEAQDSYDTFNTVSYITLSVGLACLGVSAYYYITSYEKESFEPVLEDKEKFSLEPIIYAGHDSVMLSLNCRF